MLKNKTNYRKTKKLRNLKNDFVFCIPKILCRLGREPQPYTVTVIKVVVIHFFLRQ